MSFGVLDLSTPIQLHNFTVEASPSLGPSIARPDYEDRGRRRTSKSSEERSPADSQDVPEKVEQDAGGSYKFINSSKPLDLKASEHRKVVRSQAARLQPLQDHSHVAARTKKRRRQGRLNRNITFRIDLRVSTACQRAIRRSEKSTSQIKQLAEALSPRVPQSPDGGWPMPFAGLSARSHAFTPGLMNHCELGDTSACGHSIRCVAKDRAQNLQTLLYLPPTSKSSICGNRAFCARVGFRWREPVPTIEICNIFLLTRSSHRLTEPATFQIILLTSASHYCMINNMQRAAHLLQLRQETLRLINDLLKDSAKAVTDTAIAAVAKLASYEAQFGDPALYQIHMDGLIRMVMMRGGLSKLGLNGLLMRMLLWIDVNARHLINTPLYVASCLVDRGTELPPPNPALYIGGV